ncbi:MAG TPA: Chromate resistance protein ChrB [Lachnospiraceae bacterium]|nr:Chromate resistance protein ChrB [Lachnospiraceae bacterium]
MSMEFLIFTYKIASEPSKNRVYIWRTLKELGVVYIQQGVVLLPDKQELYSLLISLREQIHTWGGKSSLGKMNFLQPEDERDLVEEFKSQIDKEYLEFIENCNRFVNELDLDREQGEFNFSEITENEEEYKKYKRWYQKIEKRDYFMSELKAQASELLEIANRKMLEFSEEVYKREL